MATLKELKADFKKAKETAKIADNARTAAKNAIHDYLKSCIETLVSEGDLRVSTAGRCYENDLYDIYLWSDTIHIYDKRTSSLSYTARKEWEERTNAKSSGGLIPMRASARREGYQAGYDFLNKLAGRLQ